MGCLFSKNGQVRTLSDDVEEPLPASAFSTRGAAHAWLQEIGLPQYAEAFDDAGFSDWGLLSCLTEPDLDAITAHTGTRIPPGHRKKLLMASRQMGATGQMGPGAAPPLGSARRYSHSSNPGNGNGSRAGGLAAAAAAVVSLERRSNGLRANSTSRVPSLASVHAGLHPPGQGPGHPPHLSLGGSPSRNATEDGIVSGRRSRAMGVMVPSRNSSRNSLSAAGAGHAIGYIASPANVGQEAGGGGSDPWVGADGRRSPMEPGSPSLAAAAVGGPTPPRQRRRWSANRCASRGVLIGGGAAVNMPASASSYGWLEPEAVASALGGVGPTTDDVRQISMTSSIGDAFGGVGGGGGGGAVPAVHRSISRDLDTLVMGANSSAYRAPSSRCQSLAARPDRSYGGGGGGASGSGLPSSPPPQRISGGQLAAAGAQGAPSLLGDLPYVRGSLRQAAAAAAAQCPTYHSQSQPNLDSADQRPTSPQSQQRVSSARDGAAANPNVPAPTAAVGGGGGAANLWGIGITGSPSLKRPGSAADSAPKPVASSPPPRPPTGTGSAAMTSSSPPPPGVAWALQGDADITAGPAINAAAAASRPLDGDAALHALSARGTASPGGALPRFVRAIAGWAIPTPVSGGAMPDGGGDAAAVGAHRARSANRQRRAHQRQSEPQPGRPRSRSGSAVKGTGEVPEQGSRAESPVAGDVLAAPAAAGTAARAAAGATMAEPMPNGEVQGGRSQRQMMIPDAVTPRGVWDQDSALCIQGRGYKPPQHPVCRGPTMRHVAAAGAAATTAAVATASGGGSGAGRDSGAGDEDSDAGPPPSFGHLTSGGGAALAANCAVAARGGGWPFVMPQLPLPARTSHVDASGALQVLLPMTAAATPPRAVGGAGGGRAAASAAVAAAAAAAAAADDFAPSSGSYGTTAGGGPLPGMYGKMSAVPESLPPSMLLESLASDASAATTARRAPPVHSSRPCDWRPSVGGASEPMTSTAVAEQLVSGAHHLKSDPDVDGMSSADESALHGSSSVPRAHRVQIVSSAMAMAAPYNVGGGTGGATAGQSPRAAAAQWPAMPLQPPTRSKPAAPPLVSGLMAPEAPGLAPPPPPNGDGGSGGGGLPRPTPGRKLDLEMLSEQVGRIMTHLTNMTKEGDEPGDGAASEAPAQAANGGGGGAGAPASVENGARRRGGDVMDIKYGSRGGEGGGGGAEPADAAGISSLRPGTRLQVIDQKRLELQHLHRDLVQRVAAMASDSPPVVAPAGHAAAAATAPAAGGGGGDDSGSDTSAAEALAEVESRIRTKLAELAALTMRPDPDRRTASAAAITSGGSSSGAARKRTLGSDFVESPEASLAAVGWDEAAEYGGPAGGDNGRRRARDEAALHLEVMAVLGARKRQVRGASSVATGAAAAARPGPLRPNGSGSEDGGQQRRHTPRPPGPERLGAAACAEGGLAHRHSPASAAALSGRENGGGRDAAAGVVLSEMHDALKAELLAIDSKIKARVLGSGAGVRGSRRD